MARKTYNDALEVEPEAAVAGSRPVRRAQKTKSASQSRKRRRQPASAPGGIHQRANKRLAW